MKQTFVFKLALTLSLSLFQEISSVSVADDPNGSEIRTPSQTSCEFIQPDEGNLCHRHGSNSCACSRAGCETSLSKKVCVPYKSCQERFDDCTRTSQQSRCLRHGAFYLNGGVLCRYMNRTAEAPDCTGIEDHRREYKCEIDETVTAVKMTLEPRRSITDSRGITYLPESRYENPGSTRREGPASRSSCKNTISKSNIPEEDKVLYPGVVWGVQTGKTCLSYIIPPLRQVGEYELSIKFLEEYKANNEDRRSFVVKLDELVLIDDLDVFKYVGRCQPMEVVIPIVVYEDGGITKMYVEGFDDVSYNRNKNLKLSFCYGTCKSLNLEYIVSAFYVVKMKNLNGERHTNSLKSTTECSSTDPPRFSNHTVCHTVEYPLPPPEEPSPPAGPDPPLPPNHPNENANQPPNPVELPPVDTPGVLPPPN